MKTSIVLISIFVIIAVFVVIFIGGIISWSNNEVVLRNVVLTQQKANESDFDKMWKVISQTAQVTDKYKDSFRATYTDIMNARYGDDKNTMWKWVTESNPQFDSKLFDKLMTIIEANREQFNTNQKTLLDKSKEHSIVLETFPGSLYNMFFGRQKIEVKIVTSTKTEESFNTGKDDDVKLP